MTAHPFNPRILRIQESVAPLLRFYLDSPWTQRRTEPGISDFTFGNPHEMPLEGFTRAVQQWAVPQSPDWFAYKDNEPAAQAAVAEALHARFGIAFEAQDICLTTGAFAALAVVCNTVLEPGDEVIFSVPGWFFYDGIVQQAGGVPVRVPVRPGDFDLDVDAIAAAITPRTRAVIVNSPNNPSGRIYPPATLRRLADALTHSGLQHGRTIYLISDEAYNAIVFDGRDHTTPVAFYPDSFYVYTFGKVLLTPGQRIGYIALPPTLAQRDELRHAIFVTQLALGWTFPNAVLQYALPDLLGLSIDVGHLQRKRDRLVGSLRAQGYEVSEPEGTFYLLVKAPWEDDAAFCDLLAEHDVFCLPGAVLEMPGYFRISLTANDAMIDRALPHFAAALETARART